MSYSTTILADSPTAFWLLNETSGTIANDASGHARTGTYTGGFTLNQAGPSTQIPTAAAFNGTTGYVNLSSPSALNPTATGFSIEMWAKLTAIDNAKVMYGNSGSAWALFTNGVTGTVAVRATTSGGQGNSISTAGLVVGTWYYLVGTWSGSSSQIYVNGVAAGSAGATTGGVASNTGPWSIGTAGGASHFTPGSIAAVAVYPLALTQAQITNHYVAGGGILPGYFNKNHIQSGAPCPPRLFTP